VPELRAPALERLATLLVRAGRPAEALALGGASSFSDPDALTAVGIAEAQAGRLDQATVLFRQALEKDPQYGLAHFNLGTALAKSGDLQGAREHLEKAVASQPKLAAAWNALGSARAGLGDEAGALECWRRAVELDRTQYDALYNIAIVEGRRGNVESARRSLQRFVETAPPSLFARDLAEARRLLKSLGPG
jgi:tetratricopeptide (TPR) repeat protein